jgi:hypothetical protein
VEPPSRITGSRAIGTPFLCDQCSFYPTRRLSLMACRDRSLPECVEPFYVLLDELGQSLESATLWARMGEGNKAHRILEKLMLQSTSPDMLSDAYSQVDGHLWVPAAIAEMLLQSQNDDIVLLFFLWSRATTARGWLPARRTGLASAPRCVAGWICSWDEGSPSSDCRFLIEE